MKKHITIMVVGIALAAALVFSACANLGGEETLKKIAKPYISIQPQSYSYSTDQYSQPPQLSIEIYEWESADGSLSYQWYTFDSIEAYCTNKGGTAISGASGSMPASEVASASYTPTNISATAGTVYYYYVVVTNTDSSASDSTRATVQSEVAAISFSAPGDPLVPVISRHPFGATYGWGAAISDLKVSASASDDGVLSYQWFINESYSVTGGTVIPEENQSIINPHWDYLSLGDNYIYAVVTSTLGDKTAQAISVPAILTTKPGIRAAAPRINQQPKDTLYFTGGTIQPLSVDSVSVDNGSLSYQWYSNTEALNKNGEAISGATSATYLPPIDANTVGNSFYYVEITNTNNNVQEEKTATIASKAVKVRVAAAASNTDADIYLSIPDPSLPANRQQYIRGYGGMDVAWGNFPRTRQEDTELMYDPDRLGYNILRIMIMPNNIDIETTMRDLVAGDRPDYYENVKIVNKYGGYVAASPWTPPKEWKSNNSINGGGILIPSYYKLFATYLRNFAQHMYNNGAPIYAISISNEPNYVAGYDGCEWSPEEMRDFYIECGHFTDGIRGFGGGREIPYVLTMNGESANTPAINGAALRDPRSRAVIDLLARHIYGERKVSLWNNDAYRPLLNRPDGTQTEVWMTEHNINSANATGYYNDSTWNYVWRFLNDVDLVIRMNNENAFVWWASKRFYSMVGDGQFGTTEGAPLPRGWALSHYSRFTIDSTRINFNVDLTKSYLTEQNGTRVQVRNTDRSTSLLNNDVDDMDNLCARITAFVSADGNEITMVLWTPTSTNGNNGYSMGRVKIDLPPGFVAQSATAVRSWGTVASQLFQPDEVELSADRTSAYVEVPRGNILSIRISK